MTELLCDYCGSEIETQGRDPEWACPPCGLGFCSEDCFEAHDGEMDGSCWLTPEDE